MIGEDRRAYRGTGFFEQFFRILSNKDIYRTIYLPLSGDDEKTALVRAKQKSAATS